jgi:hypothetical protein
MAIPRVITNPATSSSVSSAVIRNELQILENEIAVLETPVIGEVMGGTVNGSNKDFTFANTPTAGTYAIYDEQGLRMREGVDFTLAGNIATFINAPINVAPICDYRY